LNYGNNLSYSTKILNPESLQIVTDQREQPFNFILKPPDNLSLSDDQQDVIDNDTKIWFLNGVMLTERNRILNSYYCSVPDYLKAAANDIVCTRNWSYNFEDGEEFTGGFDSNYFYMTKAATNSSTIY
jgi:hypothetical protein